MAARHPYRVLSPLPVACACALRSAQCSLQLFRVLLCTAPACQVCSCSVCSCSECKCAQGSAAAARMAAAAVASLLRTVRVFVLQLADLRGGRGQGVCGCITTRACVCEDACDAAAWCVYSNSLAVCSTATARQEVVCFISFVEQEQQGLWRRMSQQAGF
jgi:hypothetical protein